MDAGGNGSAEFTFKRSAFNRIVVHGASGADALSINESYGVFTGSEATSLFGDTGNDLLRGGSGAERLFGGIGNDTIDGKRGNDLIEGGAGSDLVVFNGSNAAEKFEFSANGNRLRFVAASTMNIAGVERFDLRAFGGADNVVVNDLSGAGLGQLNADLANDGAADVVDIKGSSAANELRVGGGISISGIGAAVNVLARAGRERQAEPRSGRGQRPRHRRGHGRKRHHRRRSVGGRGPHIAVSGGPGGLPIDVVNAEALADRVPRRQRHAQRRARACRAHPADAGRRGRQRRDQRRRRQRHAARRRRATTRSTATAAPTSALMGAGDDSFTWDPGDGSDKVEGEAGSDTMVFNGAAAAENFDFSANGNRLRFFRTRAPSRWTPPASSGSISAPSAASTTRS